MVLGAMDSHRDLSLQILNYQNIMKKLLGERVPLVYRHFNAKPGPTADDASGPAPRRSTW
jgi:hypothetical protein